MKEIEITFPKLNHFWFDSGLLGLSKMLDETNSKVIIKRNNSGLTLNGTEKEIKESLKNAYDLLVTRYYDRSTKKQIDNTASHNFYYDSKQDQFFPFPKKKAVGIAELIYNKAPRASGDLVKWDKKVNRNRGILPPTHAYLQKRLDQFIDKQGLDVTTSGLLIDGPNEVRPKIYLPDKFSGNKEQVCYICGEETIKSVDAGQTIFPFITGSSGLLNFNSFCSNPEKVCWKCALIGKFVPVNGFYLSQGDNLFIFLPYSISFEKMLEVYNPLQDAKYEDPNLFKNFKHPLGFKKYEDGFFQKPFEVTFAFFYTLYRKVLLHQGMEEEQDILNWEEMCNLTISKAPLEFIVLQAKSKGQTAMGKMIWPFRDSVYFFRLMESIEKNGINIKEIMGLFIDCSQKSIENKTILRDKFCERILKKRTVLDIVEERVWDLVFPKDEKKTPPENPSPLIDFLLQYETIIKGENMNKEERIVATTLGKNIGLSVKKRENDFRSKNEIYRDIKRLKGDLIKLKKVRKLTDFLSELERLQIKYDFSFHIPDGLLEGELRDDNFKEFKSFCNLSAMKAYSSVKYYAFKEDN